MAKAYQCDRCGRYFKTAYQNTVIEGVNENRFETPGRHRLRMYFETNKGAIPYEEWFDLCSECYEELSDWVEKGAK